MIGYFGENWSDADVIKSDLVIEDLAMTDNPYRIDVDDGYDRWELYHSVKKCIIFLLRFINS